MDCAGPTNGSQRETVAVAVQPDGIARLSPTGDVALEYAAGERMFVDFAGGHTTAVE
jgi:hypothetical protein